MDIWHRLGRIFRFSNLGTLIFFLLNIGLILALFCPYGVTFEAAAPLVVCYIVTVLISLSPIGEWTLAALAGAKEIKRKDIKIRLIPLLEIVFEQAKERTPSMINSIRLKIIHDQSPNAFAIGRRTICVTDGLLNLSDEEIMAVFAHEVGHLAYQHSHSLANFLQGEKYVALLVKSLQDYENVNLAGGTPPPTSNSASNTTNSFSGNDNNATVKLAGKEWSDNLSPSERSAIKDYTGTSYVNINAVLRGLESDFDAGNHERASLIHSALSQSSIPQSCTVYRGASLSSLGNYANATDEELIGNIISDDGFMSTSLNREDAFGGEIRYEISVPEGANGAYVGYLSHAQHYESEVLFDCGQMLQITDVRRDMFGNRTIVARMLV